MKNEDTKKVEKKPKVEVIRKGRELEELEDHELDGVSGAGIGCGGPGECLANQSK